MKRVVSAALAVSLFVVCAHAAFAGKGDRDGKGGAAWNLRPVAVVATAGVPGIEDQAPYFTVPEVVHLSDDTPSDTIHTSTPTWINQPLWRLTTARESRLDIEGPVTVTCITMAPINERTIGTTRYRIATRMDNEKTPCTILLAARVGNPIITGRGGPTCGLPQGFEVQVPAGRHSLRFKVAEGDFGATGCCYALFQVSRHPLQLAAPDSLAAAAPAGGKRDDSDPKPMDCPLRYVLLVSSIYFPGYDKVPAFLTAPQVVMLSDSTPADTILTSSTVWITQPLWHLTRERWARMDVEGPVTITCTTRAPFHRDGLGFSMDYKVAAQVDDGPPHTVKLATHRENPLYTTGVSGWSFGSPQAFEVQVPPGKHSVGFKLDDGAMDFCFGVFQSGRSPKDLPLDEGPAKKK